MAHSRISRYLPAILICMVFALFIWGFFTLHTVHTAASPGTNPANPLSTPRTIVQNAAQTGNMQEKEATPEALPASTKAQALLQPEAALAACPAPPLPAAIARLFKPKPLYDPVHKTHPILGLEASLRLAALAGEGLDPAFHALIDRLVEDGFKRAEMVALFASLGPKAFSPQFMAAKVAELHGVGARGINSRYKPGEFSPAGYQRPVNATTYAAILDLIETHAAAFEDIKKRYGVPANVIIGILLVETGLGANLGGDPALLSLGSMAATNSITMLNTRGNGLQSRQLNASRLEGTLRTKSDWAYNELVALIRFGAENCLDIARVPGSMYGAIGLCQFMPSNLPLFGVDGNNDGIINLFSIEDAIYSVANYLYQNGWHPRGGRDHQLRVIYTYNHDHSYAYSVLALADKVSQATAGKVGLHLNALGSVSRFGGYRDKYLSKRGRVGARISGMGSYSSILAQ